MKLKRIGSFILAVVVALSMTNLTVFAWDWPTYHTVTFYRNDNSWPTDWVGVRIVEKNHTVNDPPKLGSRSGYTFVGWNTERSGNGNPFITGSGGSKVQSDMKVYAQWAKNYTVTYRNGGQVLTNPASHTAYEGQEFFLPDAPAPTGYDFAGWLHGSTPYNKGASFTMPNSNVIFDAQWQAKTDTKYTVRYYLEQTDGEYPTTPQTITLYGTTDSPVTAPPLSSLPSGYELRDGLPSGTVTADGNLVLDVYYNLKRYTITFNEGDHGTLSSSETFSARHGQKFDDVVTAVPTVTPDTGWDFEAWHPEAPPTNNPEIVGDMEYTAQYNPKGYTVTTTHIYGANGGEEVVSEAVNFNQPVRVEQLPKPGYTLNEDNVTVNGMTDTDATPGVVAGTMPNGNVEITFFYLPGDATYTVKYYYGDGSEGPELEVPHSDKKVDETLRQSDIDTTSDAVVRDGYYYAETVGVPLKLSHDAAKNVVKVYFSTATPPLPNEEQEETNFKVIHKYYLNGNLVETQTDYRLFAEPASIPLNSLLRPKTGYTPQSEVQVDITALLYPYRVEHYLMDGETPVLATTVNGRAQLGSAVNAATKEFNGYLPAVDNNDEPTSVVIGKVASANVVKLYYELGGNQFAQLPLGIELTAELLDSLTKLPENPAPQPPAEGESTPGEQPGENEAPPAEEPGDEEAPPAENPEDEQTPPAEQPKDDEAPPAEQPGENEAPPADVEEGAEFEGVGTASEGGYQITDDLAYDPANSYVVTIIYTRTTSAPSSRDDDDDEPFSMGWDGTVVAEPPLGALPKTGGDSKRMGGLGAMLLLSGTVLKGMRFRKAQKGRGREEQE